MFRYIIRPDGILTTPRILKDAFNARRTASVSTIRTGRLIGSFQRDLYLTYPRESCPEDVGADDYHTISSFASANKRDQRVLLGSYGTPVPPFPSRTLSMERTATDASGNSFVVRPLRHSQGIGYRITDRADDFDAQSEYISEVFPKRYEYRLIYFFGTHLITLRKMVPEGLSPLEPWNHANGSRFVTVEDWSTCRLRHTDVLDVLANNKIIQLAHLVGVDVLYADKQLGYVITEFNFCPAITIPNNIRKLQAHALQLSR